jgi:dienelactone hydrolase
MDKTSRRKFIKAGFAVAGAGLLNSPLSYGANCDPEQLYSPGPIPLNDILTDYLQENPKYGFGLIKSPICDKEGWYDKKSSILQRARLMLGQAPPVNANPVKADILGETKRNGYREQKIQFLSGTGDMIKGFLLVPDKARSLPAIMALHATGPGATQTVGLTPKEGRGYGMELAQRGYVVLAIDTITAGERVYPGYGPYYTNKFYEEHPQWSAMDKMISDHKRGLDFLCSLNYVDQNRLGCIGHSLGGYNAFFLQAFEPRIKAAVSSCGLSPMGGTNTPYQFARNDWFVHFNPACRDYIRAGMIPCDMHEFMALCAPRPLFNYSARKDNIYFRPSLHKEGDYSDWWQTVDKALSQVAKVYEILGAKDQFVRVEDNGGHDFPSDVRTASYQWLDKQLGVA